MHDVAKPEAIPAQKRRSSKFLAVIVALAAIGALVVLLGGIKAAQFKKMGAAAGAGGMPPTTVSSVEVKEEHWAPTIYAVGSISPVQGAVISSELSGVVAEVGFESGSLVKKGDLLVRLDTSAEEAQLRAADAEAEWARADVERARELAARNVISKSEFDAAEARAKQRTAASENIRAMIAKKTMRAPFDGIAGIRAVNVGQTVREGDKIVPLQSLDPVYVDFGLPEQRLAELAPGLEVRIKTDTFPGREFRGTLTAINSMVEMA
ncbi:MAG TPA: efflux RND transporter periplasmic adaptor subunit, partial [Chthoniobacterales bacterium]|nr:efflux RND transporter periplasmic adaptor subunit [Chthoniobacterales bacterium]